MKRTLLAIGLVLSAGLAHAGGVVDRNGTQPECPNKAVEKAQAPAASDEGIAATSATRPAKSNARGGGAGSASTKLVSPRWHSLLPGMFR